MKRAVEDIVKDKGYLTLGSRLRRIGERLQADVQQLAHNEGMDVPTGLFPTLGAIDAKGGLTIGELAIALGVSQPGATRNINQLLKLGLVAAVADENDKRIKRIALTAKCKALVKNARSDLWPRIEKAVAEICQPLPGNLLTTLSAIEAALDEEPLHQRAAKSRKTKRK